jgi:hypothetical protein
MAKAKMTEKGNVRVTLSHKEALYLCRLLGHHVTGYCQDHPRGVLSGIGAVLEPIVGYGNPFRVSTLNNPADQLYLMEDAS